MPKKLNLDGLKEHVNLEKLFSIPLDFWEEEVKEIAKYFDDQVNDDLPAEIAEQLQQLRIRLEQMKDCDEAEFEVRAKMAN